MSNTSIWAVYKQLPDGSRIRLSVEPMTEDAAKGDAESRTRRQLEESKKDGTTPSGSFVAKQIING